MSNTHHVFLNFGRLSSFRTSEEVYLDVTAQPLHGNAKCYEHTVVNLSNMD